MPGADQLGVRAPITSGLQFQTIIARAPAGSWLGVGERLAEAAHVDPSRLRARRAGRGGSSAACVDDGVGPRRRRSRRQPPPRSRHAPTSAGRQASVRKNIAPFSWCSAPIERADGRRADRAVHRGRALDVGGVEAAVPRAARSGVHSATWAASSSKPSGVRRRPTAWSTRPSRISTCIIASIKAMSVPGSGWMNQSARVGGDRADRVDHDDLRAPSAGLLDGRPEVAVGEPGVGAPQDDELASGASRAGRGPWPVPLVIVTPAPTVGPQIARVTRVAPRWCQNRSPNPSRQQALVAGVAVRHDRLGAVLGR